MQKPVGVAHSVAELRSGSDIHRLLDQPQSRGRVQDEKREDLINLGIHCITVVERLVDPVVTLGFLRKDILTGQKIFHRATTSNQPGDVLASSTAGHEAENALRLSETRVKLDCEAHVERNEEFVSPAASDTIDSTDCYLVELCHVVEKLCCTLCDGSI